MKPEVANMEKNLIYHQKGRDELYKTWHASREHLCMYIHSGGGSLVCADRIFPLEEGSLVFIAAGAYHYTMPDDPKNYDRSKLFSTAQQLHRVMTLLGDDPLSRFFANKAFVYARVEEKDREEVEKLFCPEEGDALLYAKLLQLLFFLKKYTVDSTASPAGFLSRAIAHIHKNIAAPLDVDGICAAINISKYHFCRQFKQGTGMTVMEYILKTRIVLAKNDLRKTTLPIMQISDNAGFSSPAYFCRVFKQETGLTPLQYRRKKTDE